MKASKTSHKHKLFGTSEIYCFIPSLLLTIMFWGNVSVSGCLLLTKRPEKKKSKKLIMAGSVLILK